MKIIKTAKYVRNLYKISQNTPSIMYHVTEEKNIPRILKEGLKMGMGTSYTPEWANDYYEDQIPIFLSIKPWEEGEGLKAIQINVSGLELYPDIPSLEDYGGVKTEDESGYIELYFPDKYLGRIGPLAEYLDEENSIYADDLLEGGSEAGRVAIELTGTAVVLQYIPSERIIGVLDTFKKERNSEKAREKDDKLRFDNFSKKKKELEQFPDILVEEDGEEEDMDF